MKQILLPDLIRIHKFGKNIIKQKIFDCREFKSSSIEVGNFHLVIKNENNEVVCIVQRNKAYPSGIARVLQIGKKPTPENVFDASITWLKCPGLQTPFVPEEIRKTWKNSFSFKEEDMKNDILGLRKPQIAGIFSDSHGNEAQGKRAIKAYWWHGILGHQLLLYR